MQGLLNVVTRRVTQSLVAILLLAGSGAFAAGSAKIGTVIWIGYGPYYVADALDLYKKSGIKVTLQVFSDPALIPPAIGRRLGRRRHADYDQVIGQVAKGSTQRVVSRSITPPAATRSSAAWTSRRSPTSRARKSATTRFRLRTSCCRTRSRSTR